MLRTSRHFLFLKKRLRIQTCFCLAVAFFSMEEKPGIGLRSQACSVVWWCKTLKKVPHSRFDIKFYYFFLSKGTTENLLHVKRNFYSIAILFSQQVTFLNHEQQVLLKLPRSQTSLSQRGPQLLVFHFRLFSGPKCGRKSLKRRHLLTNCNDSLLLQSPLLK